MIGVGWFLGLIFVFYLCFPFFCVLISNKKLAWFSFVISLLYNYVCVNYFDVGRTNILYCACFFLAGGLIYLYRDVLAKVHFYIAIAITAMSIFAYYIMRGQAMNCLLVSACLLICAINVRTPQSNHMVRFLSGISMEIYLSHMVLFRVIEKLGLSISFGNDWKQYLVTVGLVLLATIIFSVTMKNVIVLVENRGLVFLKSKN